MDARRSGLFSSASRLIFRTTPNRPRTTNLYWAQRKNQHVRSGSRFLSTIFLAAAFVSSLAGIGCGDHHHRLYDPYYSDYHT